MVLNSMHKHFRPRPSLEPNKHRNCDKLANLIANKPATYLIYGFHSGKLFHWPAGVDERRRADNVHSTRIAAGRISGGYSWRTTLSRELLI
jgi:hypothetical protein